MTVHIDLPSVPLLCWLWTYLALCYLILGPWLSRTYYRLWKDARYYKGWFREYDLHNHCIALYLLSPTTVPLVPLRYLLVWAVFPVLNWLIFGSRK